MSKVKISKNKIAKLKGNENVKNVTEKGITYTDAFKQRTVKEMQLGKSPIQIFEENGLTVELIGNARISSSANRWKEQYKNKGILGLTDKRKEKSGRPKKKEETEDEKITKLQWENKLLKAENELLKKIELLEKGVL